MSGNAPFWDTLGVARNASEKEIRRAYAVKLKQIDPSEDAAGFQVLRSAYEIALAYARRRPVRIPRPTIAEAEATQTEDHAEEPTLPDAALRDVPVLPDPTLPLKAMQALVGSEDFSVRAWHNLLNDPLLDPPEVKAAFEYALVQALSEHPINLVVSTSPEWRSLIESRYGWIADGLRYSRRFPQNHELRQLLASLGKPKVRPKFSFSALVWSIRANLDGRAIGVVLVVIYVIVKVIAANYRSGR